MLFAVDNDCGDLLVHEEKDGDEQGGKRGRQVHPPGIAPERRHKPAAVGTGGLRGRGLAEQERGMD